MSIRLKKPYTNAIVDSQKKKEFLIAYYFKNVNNTNNFHTFKKYSSTFLHNHLYENIKT